MPLPFVHPLSIPSRPNRRRITKSTTLAGAVASLLLSTVLGAQAVKEELLQKDFPFTTACIGAQFPSNNVAYKGIAIRVSPEATMLWDTDLLRYAAGWTGGYITTTGVAFDAAHGKHPNLNGDQKFGTIHGPGVAGSDGDFSDRRPEPYGPLSAELARWDGLYVHGMKVLLNYTVRGTKIAEEPGSVASEGEVAFTRTIRLTPPKTGVIFKSQRVPEAFSLAICDVEGANGSSSAKEARLTRDGQQTRVALVGAPSGVSLKNEAGRITLQVAKGTRAGTLKVVIWNGSEAAAAGFGKLAAGLPALSADFARGGAPHWPEPVVTKGTLRTSQTPDGAYVTDSLTSPENNPWKRQIRWGGFDFFRDGKSAAFCTHDGDVWTVSGIDDKLENLTWRRFASGLYEPLGLVVADDVIYVSGRDGITRLRDLNGDGAADAYENFNNQVMSTRGFHEFVFDLQRDAAGNFYFAKANPVNGGGRGFGNWQASLGNGSVCSHAGCLFKVSPDGKKFEIIARGLRAPNGIGVRADGQVTTSDNEGTWVPTTPINWVDGRTFHGVQNEFTTAVNDRYAPPLMWLSHNDYDNSGGGQIWVSSDKWGPFKGELLHESYGKSALYLIMRQDLPGGRQQGAAVRFPLKFTSSVMRARFGPQDGQLYVAGLSEWQSNAARKTGFDRVRYTGKPVYGVTGTKVVPGGVQLTFSQPLDSASVSDVQNWSGKRWNYRRSENYGSPELSVKDPKKNGRDTLNIVSAQLAADGRTVTVLIENTIPAMQQSLKWDLKAKDGTPIAQEIQQTIHEVPAGNAVN